MMEQIKNQDRLRLAITILGGVVIALIIFSAGLYIGSAKTRFSYRWADNYHQNFAGPRQGLFGQIKELVPPDKEFLESRGGVGKIIAINQSDIVIKDPADMEKVIILSDETLIKNGRDTVAKDQLSVGETIVIVGSPNDSGQIEAKLIRIFNGQAMPMDNGPMPR